MQINQYYQSITQSRRQYSAFLHFTLIGLLGYWVIGLFPQTAYAETVSLGVSPAILQIEAIPPADARAPFTVENLSDEPVELKIGYKLFKASEEGDGKIEYLREKDPFPGANPQIFEQIEIVDEDNFSIDSLSLGPKQKANLVLRVVVPKKEPLSDYYFSLIFLTQPQKEAKPCTEGCEEEEETDVPVLIPDKKEKEKTTASTSQVGIAMNVLLSIGAKDAAKAYIEEFATSWYKESGPVPFTVKVKNNGSHVIKPKGMITIKNMFGQTIGRVELEQSNVLAGSSRYLINTKIPSNQAAIWPESFLLGFYTATLSIAMSEQAPVFTRSIHFVAIPVKLLIGITIASLIIILGYFRIKGRMERE